MDHSSEKVSQEYEEKQLKTTYKRKKRAPKEAGVAYRKAPQAPKRFKSPYILFSMSKMEEHRNKHGGKTKVSHSLESGILLLSDPSLCMYSDI